MQYTYSRWTGIDGACGVEPDALLGAIGDDLLAHDDVARALNTLVRDGVDAPDIRLRGIQDILEDLQERRSAQFDRHDLVSALHDLQRTVSDLLAAEKRALEGPKEDFHDGEGGGGSNEFQQSPQRLGHHAPDTVSFPDLVHRMREQSLAAAPLLESLGPDTLQKLQDTLEALLRGSQVHSVLDRPADNADSAHEIGDLPSHRLAIAESPAVDEALQVMGRMADMDALERSLRSAQESGDLSTIDMEMVRHILGDVVVAAIEELKSLEGILREAGYVDGDSAPALTARGIRQIGARAADEIFRELRRSAPGDHTVARTGSGADRSDQTKEYEYGDHFLLDLGQTLANTLLRGGPGTPLRVQVEDFEVFRTDRGARSATVLMLDMSRSMPLRGCVGAARKVALALNSLIRTRFPRDAMYVVGFADLAREMKPEALHRAAWNEGVYGTNMQHGFMVARRLLGRHREGTRQIVLITDGEPTAHLEENRVQFAYPPSPRTFEETLREVHRCTDEKIIINTFMLDRSHYLADFVKRMTLINGGRAFFATPERLGDYILVDYVRSRSGAAGSERRSASRRL